MSTAFRFELQGEKRGVRVFLGLTFPLVSALVCAVGVAVETWLQANPHRVGSTLKADDFWK